MLTYFGEAGQLGMMTIELSGAFAFVFVLVLIPQAILILQIRLGVLFELPPL